jgi:hypothetical protein
MQPAILARPTSLCDGPVVPGDALEKKVSTNPIIESMKGCFRERVSEWLGFDVPSEGTEDFDTWTSKVADIDGIESISDVVWYLDMENTDLDDFVIDHEFDLVGAGMAPVDIPYAVIEALGQAVDPPDGWDERDESIYMYGGKCFVLAASNLESPRVFDSVSDALRARGETQP